MYRLSTLDSGFLITESHHSPKHVAGMQIMQLPRGKGSAWLRSLLDEIKRVPPGFPFDQRLRDNSLLRPTLVTDLDIDMDYHVRHSVVPGPGNDAQLSEVVARLHANLLDRERPLWEFHLIEGLSGRRFAFYTKIHHAIVDGITFARWFAQSGSPDATELDCPPIWHRDEAPGKPARDGNLAELLADALNMFGGGARTAFDLAALTARLVRKSVFERDRNAVLPLAAARTPLNVPTGAARNFCINDFPLDQVSAVAKNRDASINDVVLTLCDLAVNRYLAERGKAPEEPLVVYMPVNLRQDEDEAGNLVSLLQVKLGSDHEDPLKTLEQVQKASRDTREIYGSVSRPAIQLYSLLVALLPLGEELLHVDQFLPPAINLVVSNIPGVRETMYFRGAEVVGVYPVNTLPPAVALSMTVCSYAGKLYFGLVSGRTALPDIERLNSHLSAAYGELRELAGVA